MAIPHPAAMYSTYHYKRRRTATSVFAGDFNTRPHQRDVLTSLLNGVPKNAAVEDIEEEEEIDRRARKKEKRIEREKDKARQKELDKKRAKSSTKALEGVHIVPGTSATAPVPAPKEKRKVQTPIPISSTPSMPSSFWAARPSINIATLSRNRSETPPQMPSSPASTPGPSVSSATSTTSSKRPRTPDDDEDIDGRGRSVGTYSPQPDTLIPRPPRKKRQAARKGWKGWVEGSPPPSEKLINLDAVPILAERKTRSGKNFDAIGVGKEGWV